MCTGNSEAKNGTLFNTKGKRKPNCQPLAYNFLASSSIIFTPRPLCPRLARCGLFNYPFLYWNRSHIKFLKEADYLTILYYWFLPAVQLKAAALVNRVEIFLWRSLCRWMVRSEDGRARFLSVSAVHGGFLFIYCLGSSIYIS